MISPFEKYLHVTEIRDWGYLYALTCFNMSQFRIEIG